MMQIKSKHIIGSIVFFLGIFLGLALAIAAIWADFEGLSYYYTGATYGQFNGLHCPILMTRSETGTITATFNNPGNQIYEPYYQMEIGGLLPRNFEDQLSIPPHTTKSVQWTVDAHDIDLGFFIFAKLDTLPDAIYPSREATCGIVVLNIPGLSGNQIFGLLLVLSLLGISIGSMLWENANEPLTGKELNQKNAMQALAILVLLTMFTGFMGWWGPGILLCAMTLLFMVVMLRFAFK